MVGLLRAGGAREHTVDVAADGKITRSVRLQTVWIWTVWIWTGVGMN